MRVTLPCAPDPDHEVTRAVSNPAPLPELGFYGLAGHTESPADLLDECRDAESIGLGSCFVSERFNVKEAAALTGAAAAVTSTLGIATGVTNHNTRHPLVTATWGATVHRLSQGRFALGLGRYLFTEESQLRFFSYVNLWEHMEHFAVGLIDSRQVVYYGSVTVLALSLTVRALAARREG